MESLIRMKDINKKYKLFELNVPVFNVPKGFAIALIGENGAGKTTILDIMSGINLDFKGKVEYFGKFYSPDEDDVRERIGYTSSSNYFMSHWRINEIKEICSLLFERFDGEKFDELLKEMSLADSEKTMKKKVSELSDGSKMRLTLASIFARNTDILMMDEPASSLDPVMRDKLCEMIRDYISDGEGEKSVIFSTHNISDMENVTDYAVVVAKGRIVEKGFVEDLKEKYISVKGELSCANAAKEVLYSYSENKFGFEGICLAEDLDKLAGMDISTETASLHQISVAVMKANAK